MSLRHRTLGIVLLVVGLSMLVIGLTSYRDAAHEVEELFDASLAQQARLLDGLLQAPLAIHQREALLASLASALRRVEQGEGRGSGHRYEGELVFQLWENGRLLLRSARAPASPLTELAAGYADVRVAGHDWRVYALDAPREDRRVIVAERRAVRSELVTLIALRTLTSDLLGLPILALLLWWAIGWGLRPLSRMARQLRERDPRHLQPLALPPLPRELSTIAGALNQLLGRIRRLRVREKRFIADAAHELRTPLAVLDLHAQNALAATAPEDRREALDALRVDVARATRLATQLLTLARLEPEEPTPSYRATGLLHEVRASLARLAPVAAERGQELLLEADEGSDWTLEAEPGALDTLIQNLVGNALQHSPGGSRIRLTLEANRDALRLTIDDEGPGIPADQRRRVVERFQRAGLGAGTGLGLSIVERVVQRHGGRLTLDDAPRGGLRVRIRLPRHPTAPARATATSSGD